MSFDDYINPSMLDDSAAYSSGNFSLDNSDHHVDNSDRRVDNAADNYYNSYGSFDDDNYNNFGQQIGLRTSMGTYPLIQVDTERSAHDTTSFAFQVLIYNWF
jgi:hypothetical protein